MSGSVVDEEDLAIFETTLNQQADNIDLALAELRKDSSQQTYIDGLYRCLLTLQNSSGYMGLEECAVYAERTAALVDQGRNSDIDFGLMLDILEQECAICVV